MKPLTYEAVAKATGGRMGKSFSGEILGVSTDSRSVKQGDLFVPLVGTKFDGHDFIKNAFEAGASATLCAEDKRDRVLNIGLEKPVIFVDDTQKALLRLAGFYRSLFSVPFVAITGSVGKTTTKEMIAAVLKIRYRVLKNEGNLNNEIGLPLTLFRLEDHQVGVVEMGMSGFGEISRLSAIVKPRVGVITNIGVSHIEKLGSRENIARAKLEITEPLSKDDLVVLNADSPELYAKRGTLTPRTVYFGIEKGDLRATDIVSMGRGGVSFKVTGDIPEFSVEIPLAGTHNVYNALAAIAVGLEFGLSVDEIRRGLMDLKPNKMRLEFKKSHSGAIVIDDSYNASPDSMKAALDVLRELGEGKRKAAILGDMLELGDYAVTAHEDIGRYAASRTDMLICIGNHAEDLARGAAEAGLSPRFINTFNTNKEAMDWLGELVEDCDIILVKASRAMKMEEIVDFLIRGS
ncbi:UDP-N-acetylmuramoyl-tripeptide--D-alanyl-D-alanine ligase [Thermosediminibacter litoriperuensis]|uniref:UDP-N-acetylmuramoyl-tripeptide--D-alanyl-D-alanine ligase n=1 Tax=Thermosediminibacter litoriperuensis TaxID=291989 RepID=A0A5S5AVB9_9FIRM|nr:UDP-N-acetylmuramoyl-tripeptide--D-alanyl-D-alanine ligase [Thermosediminibacter litoriperuensis]TYP54946.1 UDP-N-acetylmuramoyl-tripeptide--D-alanyl-D-alanine ligase [Thermosediminibacter litoriperuensis]